MEILASVNMTGVSQVTLAIKKSMADLEKKAEKEFVTAAENCLSLAQTNAAVDTGKMRDSGRIENTSTPGAIDIKVAFGDDSGDFDYPWFIEMGTRFMTPQAFLLPAFDASVQALQSGLDGLVDK
jgi:HK97 gp10 family phage protein